MTLPETKNIIELFRYSEEERVLAPFLDDYTRRIDEWLCEHHFNREQLLRYMIAGLFLLYDTSVHQGSHFTTTVEELSDVDERDEARLKTFNAYYGKPISSRDEYVVLLGLTDEQTLAKFVAGKLERDKAKKMRENVTTLYEGGLFDYVIYGHYEFST